jgi:hypothetical protein
MDAAFSTFQWGLGAIFLAAGGVKLRNRAMFLRAIRSWRLSGPRSSRLLSWVIPSGEVLLGFVVILSVATQRAVIASLAVTTAVLAMFFAAQGVILLRDKSGSATCGCFGRQSRVGLASVTRTAMLLAVSGVTVLGR